MNDSYLIRNLKADEMPLIMDMVDKEGWNPGLGDGSAFFHADSKGFWVGELNNVPIAFISTVNYNNQYGFVGLYIVDKAYRNLGYGYRLWKHALSQLDNMVCGLDGVPLQIANYEKSGFIYAFRQMRLGATAIPTPQNKEIKKVDAYNIDAVIAYDSLIFGTSRSVFIRNWINMENAQAFCVIENEQINGYVVIRKCIEGYKIGPLFAKNPSSAEQLFLACHQAAHLGEMVYIDMPETNPITSEWVKRYELQLVFETARMYKNGVPAFPLEKVFGVTSFELG